MKQSSKLECSCRCKESSISVEGAPVIRFLCHCKICQAVYRKPYADIIALKSSQVIQPVDSRIKFSKHRLPPALKRGVCPSCSNPVVGFLPLMPFFGLAFIPTVNFPEHVSLPAPKFHTFYDRRVTDVEDELPKYSGYWTSQCVLTSGFFSGLLFS